MHYEIKYLFIHEVVKAGHMVVIPVPTKDQLAHIYTKPCTFKVARELLPKIFGMPLKFCQEVYDDSTRRVTWPDDRQYLAVFLYFYVNTFMATFCLYMFVCTHICMFFYLFMHHRSFLCTAYVLVTCVTVLPSTHIPRGVGRQHKVVYSQSMGVCQYSIV